MVTRIDRSLKSDVGRDAGVANGSIPGVHVTTAEEGTVLFDRQVRKTLGISGDEFLRHWDEGKYSKARDNAEGRKIRRLAMLIPFARRSKT